MATRMRLSDALFFGIFLSCKEAVFSSHLGNFSAVSFRLKFCNGKTLTMTVRVQHTVTVTVLCLQSLLVVRGLQVAQPENSLGLAGTRRGNLKA